MNETAMWWFDWTCKDCGLLSQAKNCSAEKGSANLASVSLKLKYLGRSSQAVNPHRLPQAEQCNVVQSRASPVSSAGDLCLFFKGVEPIFPAFAYSSRAS
jgi:hypothetical protein